MCRYTIARTKFKYRKYARQKQVFCTLRLMSHFSCILVQCAIFNGRPLIQLNFQLLKLCVPGFTNNAPTTSSLDTSALSVVIFPARGRFYGYMHMDV